MNLLKISDIVYKRALIVLLVVLAFASLRGVWIFESLKIQPAIGVIATGKAMSRTDMYAYEKQLRKIKVLSRLCPYVLTCTVNQSFGGQVLAQNEIEILEAEIRYHDIQHQIKDIVTPLLGDLEKAKAAVEPYKKSWIKARQDVDDAEELFISNAQLLQAPEDLRPALGELAR